jgi:Transposase DDE domain
MEQSQWTIVRAAIRHVTRSFPPLRRAQYSDFLIACLYFWAVLHDRPMTWATDASHYNRTFRPRKKIPSISQLNRRIASDRFQLILQRVHGRLAGDNRFKGLTFDGQPLLVNAVSQDRDARVGHVAGGIANGGMGKGYKLHAAVTGDGNIPVFSVMPLNAHEMPIARQMLDTLRLDLTGALIFADGNYDAHVLHKQLDARGAFLITKPRGRGKHPVTLRQMGRARRHLLDLWDKCPTLMDRVYRHRRQIERRFGNLSCTPGLLTSLPKFVRGLPRVRRFVGAKICLYHAHRMAKPAAAKVL